MPRLFFKKEEISEHLYVKIKAGKLHHRPLQKRRGNLFENMAVIVALKYLYNLGKRDNLNFFRDSSGNEIDLVYNISHNLLLIEIKSGQTITSDFFKGLKKF